MVGAFKVLCFKSCPSSLELMSPVTTFTITYVLNFRNANAGDLHID